MENNTHGIDEMFIRKRIAALREQKGVSERQMSLDLGKAENYMRNIRSGAVMPPIPMLLKICDYFGVSLRDLSDPDLDNPTLLSKLTETARTLDEEGLQAVLSVANALPKKNKDDDE